MGRESLARKNQVSDVEKIRTKPRYTHEENELIYENWWNPKLRRELSVRFNRKISALRSQFCRLLKERNVTNDEYYKLMRAKYQSSVSKQVISGDEDEQILQVFAKHQALGGTRNEACKELRGILQRNLSDAALKLRFYRLIQKRDLHEDDLFHLGQQVLTKMGVEIANTALKPQKAVEISRSTTPAPVPELPVIEEKSNESWTEKFDDSKDEKRQTFLYQLSHLPESVQRMELKIEELEKYQHRQLDLRGFIEHLLSVERNLKNEDRLMVEIDSLNQEISRLQEGMSREKERLEKREKELSEVYNILNSMFNEFMHLESVAKLASLGDFMHRLEITVDQFGTVLKSKRHTTVEKQMSFR